jgi:hypothetical protein
MISIALLAAVAAFFLTEAGYSLGAAIGLGILCAIVPPFLFGAAFGRVLAPVWPIVRLPGSLIATALSVVALSAV